MEELTNKQEDLLEHLLKQSRDKFCECGNQINIDTEDDICAECI